VPPSSDFDLPEFDLPAPERRKLTSPASQYRRPRKKMNSFVREAVGPPHILTTPYARHSRIIHRIVDPEPSFLELDGT